MGQSEVIGQSDEWYTPKLVFDALGERFDLDVAAPDNGRTFVPANSFITANSLSKEWHGFVWMNPPFGTRNALVPWLSRFLAHGNGVALVPAHTNAEWFLHAWSKSGLALFTPKLRFHLPDGTVSRSPSTGSALFAAGDRAERALRRAAARGLGILGRSEPSSEKDFADARLWQAHKDLQELFAHAGGRWAECGPEESLEMMRNALEKFAAVSSSADVAKRGGSAASPASANTALAFGGGLASATEASDILVADHELPLDRS